MTITFNCFITCLLEAYRDYLYLDLVKMGYTIGLPAFTKPEVIVNQPNQPSAVLSINVYSLDDKITSDIVLQHIKDIFHSRKLYYYSIIVFSAPHIAWVGTNIVFTPNKEVPQLPPPVEDDKNSKLN